MASSTSFHQHPFINMLNISIKKSMDGRKRKGLSFDQMLLSFLYQHMKPHQYAPYQQELLTGNFRQCFT
ncbi:hypothetical protein BSA145_09295 [Bacillus safensis]|uniref:Uncharacterized protein n=1 Tax=Bacillus safensis TaxID=561879 RepID=A0A1L6ZHS2_BACIA|nr:hypothetical protein BSA145_09295 [Bacillus safensis]